MDEDIRLCREMMRPLRLMLGENTVTVVLATQRHFISCKQQQRQQITIRHQSFSFQGEDICFQRLPVVLPVDHYAVKGSPVIGCEAVGEEEWMCRCQWIILLWQQWQRYCKHNDKEQHKSSVIYL